MGESSSSSLRQCELLEEHHPSLEVSLDTIEVSANRLDWVIIVRRVKFYSKTVGPLDDMKIVIFNNLHFTVYVFCDIFAEGDLETPQDVERLTFLVRLAGFSATEWIITLLTMFMVLKMLQMLLYLQILCGTNLARSFFNVVRHISQTCASIVCR